MNVVKTLMLQLLLVTFLAALALGSEVEGEELSEEWQQQWIHPRFRRSDESNGSSESEEDKGTTKKPAPAMSKAMSSAGVTRPTPTMLGPAITAAWIATTVPSQN